MDGADRSLAVRWVGGHLLADLVSSISFWLLLQWNQPDFQFWIGWRYVLWNAVFASLAGIAQAWALRGTRFPVPLKVWGLATALGAGLATIASHQVMWTMIRLGRPWAQSGNPEIGYLMYLLMQVSEALVLAAAQGITLRCFRVPRALAWMVVVAAAWLGSDLLTTIPLWMAPKPSGDPTVLTLFGVSIGLLEKLIFGVCTLLALRRLLLPRPAPFRRTSG